MGSAKREGIFKYLPTSKNGLATGNCSGARFQVMFRSHKRRNSFLSSFVLQDMAGLMFHEYLHWWYILKPRFVMWYCTLASSCFCTCFFSSLRITFMNIYPFAFPCCYCFVCTQEGRHFLRGSQELMIGCRLHLYFHMESRVMTDNARHRLSDTEPMTHNENVTWSITA